MEAKGEAIIETKGAEAIRNAIKETIIEATARRSHRRKS